MKLSKYKPTQKGGGRKAAAIFESTRKKEPSDRLVKIISEVGQKPSELKERKERAAKDADL